ncbi:MAG: hypothetical protein WCH34_09390, partial [Bacteroidota bacterium]
PKAYLKKTLKIPELPPLNLEFGIWNLGLPKAYLKKTLKIPELPPWDLEFEIWNLGLPIGTSS